MNRAQAVDLEEARRTEVCDCVVGKREVERRSCVGVSPSGADFSADLGASSNYCRGKRQRRRDQWFHLNRKERWVTRS